MEKKGNMFLDSAKELKKNVCTCGLCDAGCTCPDSEFCGFD